MAFLSGFFIRFNPEGVQNGRFIMNPVSTSDGTMVATEGEILNFSTPKSPENAFSGNFTYLRLVRYIIILPFFSIYFAKPTMNHCKNRFFRQNGRFRDQTGGRKTTSQNGILPFKTGGLEHMLLSHGTVDY